MNFAELKNLDCKQWSAMSCPIEGLRFDRRTLELMDTDHDGRIRMDEVLAAAEFLQNHGGELTADGEESARRDLAEIGRRQEELASATPSEADRQAMAEWQAKAVEIAEFGADTAVAESALAAVEKAIDDYFTPAEELSLVMETPAKELPLDGRINLKYYEVFTAFVEHCVNPLFGEGRQLLSYGEWRRLKAKFVAYREWQAARPTIASPAKEALDDEERAVRYRLYLPEFLENFVTMRRLYETEGGAIFQTGRLCIDGRELHLCFHVENEAAHSALVDKSKCCVLYVRLTRPAEGLERRICAVVTAGSVWSLYVGRNGVFCDRDGREWEATVSKVVEAQVSLGEAFWSPWRKIGGGVAESVKKFLGERQTMASGAVSQGIAKAATVNGAAGSNGAAMASSVAAIGIGIGMVGAALASLMAVVARLNAWQLIGSLILVVLAVSLPSVVLTWFRLRQRDLGAILNACGWAINRPMHFSMCRAAQFTVCAKESKALPLLSALLVLTIIVAIASCYLI